MVGGARNMAGPVIWRFALGSALSVALPLAALAEEARKKGMPQLDFGNPLTKAQVVWGALIFFAFYMLLSRWALPMVTSVLSEREETITADLDAARAAKSRADAAMAEQAEATAKARAEAQAAINAAVDKAKAEAAAQTAELNAKLDAQLSAAEASITAARGSAMTALQQVARETTGIMITRLTGAPVDAAVVDRAVAAALTARVGA